VIHSRKGRWRRRLGCAGAAVVAALALAACGAGREAGAGAAPPLDEVVALMRAADRWDTVQATVVGWSDAALAERAWARVEAPSDNGVILEFIGGCGVESMSSNLLVDRPDRTLVESIQRGRRYAAAHDGSRRWFRYGDDYVVSEEPPGGALLDELGSARNLLAPRPLTEALDLEMRGVEEIDGVEAIVLGGIPRPDERSHYALGAPGADELRLWVDARSGIVIRLESLLEGQPFQRTSLENLVLDGPIPPERFALVAEPGARVLSERDLTTQQMSVSDAARTVPFTVLAPPGAGAEQADVLPRFGYNGPSIHFGLQDQVSVTERRAVEYADCTTPGEQRTIRSGGVDVMVIHEGDEPTVRLIRDGTAIDVSGAGPAERLARLAASFEPVR
jgi:hypothetical protein